MSGLIAILTDNAEDAIRKLRKEETVMDYLPSRMTGVFWSGRDFRIFSDWEDLLGVRISDYRIIGRPSEQLVEKAKTRMFG